MLSIKELRTLTGLSQSKFAKRYHIGLSTLQKWERDASNPPEHYLYSLNELLKYEGYLYEASRKE